jgi:anthranilate phosphoribosyltransferase
MVKEAIHLLVQGIHLSDAEMSECMTEIMEGRATEAQIASFLTALRIKGETAEEITAAARIMREKAVHIDAPEGVLDTCGTGGDMSHTFNISTTVALVVSACGIPVAKHGNRSVSSRSGSADVLEALGVNINVDPRGVETCLFETGFGFLFAPLFHPAMRYAIGPRREIGVRTIFNILGPLTNPAGAKRQIVGIFADKLTDTIAEVLGNLGCMDAMVVHGEDGLDEITITDGTKISRFRNGSVEAGFLSPEDFGFDRHPLESILGGEREENARITLSVLKGETGPRRDIVIMNAAAALLVADRTQDLREAVNMVSEAIDSKKALEKLNRVIGVSKRL